MKKLDPVWRGRQRRAMKDFEQTDRVAFCDQRDGGVEDEPLVREPGAALGRLGMPREVQRGKRYPTTVTDFKCGRRVVATHVEVRQLGHAWSGGAAKQQFSDEKGPDASRMVWAFASRQFRGVSAEATRVRAK